MTSTDRAKAFISNKLKKTALLILPLAAATVHAHGGVILSITSGFMEASGSATTTINNPVGGTQLNNGVNGLSLFGGATFTSTTSGGGASGSACASLCAGLFAFGTGTGTYDAAPLINYDFTLTASNGQALNWDLIIYFNDFSVSSFSSGSVASGTEVSGNFLFNGMNGVSPTNWDVFLDVDFAGPFTIGDTITMDIPAGASVDLGASAVPEPGTASLIAVAGAALAGFGAIRRRLS